MIYIFPIAVIISFIVVYIILTEISSDPRKDLSDMEARFVDLFVALAKCDGKADPLEVLCIKSHICRSPRLSKRHEWIIKCLDAELKNTQVRFLGYDYERLPIFIMKRGKKDKQQTTEKVSDITIHLLKKYMRTYSERMEFMDFLFQFAYSQDGVSNVEVDFLREVAHYLDIKSWDFTAFLYKYEYLKKEQQEQKEEQKRTKKKKRTENEENERRKTHETRFENVTNTRKKEALQLLEITENADEQEIKSAYRRLVKMYHPDTLPANTSEEEKEEATERFRSIHEAYEFLLEQVVLLKK